MKILKGNALITGGSRGLGLAVADEFASKGYDLILIAKDPKRLLKVQEQLTNKYDVHIHVISCDLSQKDDISIAIEEINAKYKSLDVLVNNAGYFESGSVLSKEDSLDNMMKTNLYSAYYITRGLMKLLKSASNALIVNVSSVAGLQAYEGGGNYSISKFALRGFSLNLRHELKNTQVRVTTVYPGAFYSDSWKESDVPAERMMKVEDVAKTISQLINISDYTDIEEIILRPKNGDI